MPKEPGEPREDNESEEREMTFIEMAQAMGEITRKIQQEIKDPKEQKRKMDEFIEKMKAKQKEELAAGQIELEQQQKQSNQVMKDAIEKYNKLGGL